MDRTFSLALGKLIIAVAWADGKLHKSEITALKDELSSLPQITHEDWTILKLYMEYPLSSGEIQNTMVDFKEKYTDKEQRDLALNVLKRIIYADGEVDSKEIALYKQIVEFFESKGNSALNKLAGILKGTRVPFPGAKQMNRGISRERHLEDFMNNPIFFRFYRALSDNPVASTLPKEQLRKYCLAGGLLAKIAQSDHQIPEIEKDTMIQCLGSCMGMDREIAKSIVKHALETDVSLLNTQRVCRQFNEMTSPEERLKFVDLLVKVIKADDHVCKREIAIFKEIGMHLHVPNPHIREIIEELNKIAA
jgi:uncharacterized tellurite resistance protein B-like protein